MLAALRRSGVGARALTVRDRSDARRLGTLTARVAIVDTIAAPLAAAHLAGLRRRGTRVVALAHMRNGALALARRADRTVVVSRTLERQLVARGIDRRTISVVPPGRDGIGPVRASGSALRALCVANWTRGKGIHTLIAALAVVPELRLDLVGDTPAIDYAREVRHAIVARGLSGRVRVHGALGPARLARLYASASVFVLPSVSEAYPTVCAEALDQGLPLVACDIPAVREVVRGAAMLVPPGSSGALAAALRSLAADPSRRASLSLRARLRAKGLPTWLESETAFVRAIRG